MKSIGVPSYVSDGNEADDLIATLVARGLYSKNAVATIYSSDKDLHQCLIHKAVRQLTAMRYDYGRYKCDWMTEAMFKERYRIIPAQWIDYRALTGDPSDGIPGAKGIGGASASKLLANGMTLDALLGGEVEIPKRLRDMIEAARDMLPTYRRLIALTTDCKLREVSYREAKVTVAF